MQIWSPEEINVFRKAFGLSRRALGDLLGVTSNYIYLLEKGVKKPSKPLRLLLGYVQREFSLKEKKNVPSK